MRRRSGGGAVITPCHHCGCPPLMETTCALHVVLCPSCYDGAPDSPAYARDTAHGRTADAAIADWNDLQELRADDVADVGSQCTGCGTSIPLAGGCVGCLLTGAVAL